MQLSVLMFLQEFTRDLPFCAISKPLETPCSLEIFTAQTKFRKKLNTERLKFEVGIKFQKFQKEKMKLDFYTPSYPTFSDVGHFGRFLTDTFLAMYLNLNSQGTIVPSGDILCLNGEVGL